MPTSTVRFTAFNADPLPDAATVTLGVYTSFDYGVVTGDDTTLNTKDEGASFITVGDFGISHQAVTCRPVISPPIPAGASIRPNFVADTLADFAAFQMQVAYATAPTMPIHGGSEIGIAPDFQIARASDGANVARSIAGIRDSLNTPWSNDWWDETNCSTDGDAPAASTFEALTQPGEIAFLDPDDYLVIWFAGPNLFISQIVGQITWEPTGVSWHSVGGHFSPIAGVTPLRLTPGVGWVPKVDGPA